VPPRGAAAAVVHQKVLEELLPLHRCTPETVIIFDDQPRVWKEQDFLSRCSLVHVPATAGIAAIEASTAAGFMARGAPVHVPALWLWPPFDQLPALATARYLDLHARDFHRRRRIRESLFATFPRDIIDLVISWDVIPTGAEVWATRLTVPTAAHAAVAPRKAARCRACGHYTVLPSANDHMQRCPFCLATPPPSPTEDTGSAAATSMTSELDDEDDRMDAPIHNQLIYRDR